MELNSLLRRHGIEYMDRFFADLPEGDRALIDSVSRVAAQGDETALRLLQTIYEYGEAQAARLYYGAHAGDAYACLLLGAYHLHGKYVFARSTILAEEYLKRAAESPWQRIASAAHRELACMNASAADMKLSGYTLVKYTGSAENVVLPAMVKEIGNGAFRGNKSLRSVVLPGCVNHIGDYAFSGCVNLEKISLPGSLLTIGACAFLECAKLTHAALPEGLQTLGDSAFGSCKALMSVRVPGSLAVIGDSAFRFSGLQEAWLHKGVRRIGEKAFANTPLERIYYEETLEEIGKGAFDGCDGLSVVYEYTGGHRIHRPLRVERGNKIFTDRTVKMWVMQEENRTLIITGDEAENGMLLKLEGMPSREDETGYGFGNVGMPGGPLPFV